MWKSFTLFAAATELQLLLAARAATVHPRDHISTSLHCMRASIQLSRKVFLVCTALRRVVKDVTERASNHSVRHALLCTEMIWTLTFFPIIFVSRLQFRFHMYAAYTWMHKINERKRRSNLFRRDPLVQKRTLRPQKNKSQQPCYRAFFRNNVYLTEYCIKQ